MIGRMGTVKQMPDRELALMMWQHADRSEINYIYRRMTWLLCWYYLNGYRRFDVFDPRTGRLSPHVLDKDGNMEFQSQELLFSINQVASRVESMDYRPSVSRQGFTLPQIRNRAVCQVLLDSAVHDNHLSTVKEYFSWHYTCLGGCGVMGHVEDHPSIGLVGDLEVVHPREIFPFPAVAQDMSKQYGIMRQRMVPLDHLKLLFGPDKFTDELLEKMEWFEVNAGEPFHEKIALTTEETLAMEGRSITYQPSRGMGNPNERAGKDGRIAAVKFRELWLYGPNGVVDFYAASSGEIILDKADTEGMEVYCPLGFARFMNNGTFHGAGMFDLLFSQHRALERLQKQLYQNIFDIDRYGVLVLPQGEFNQDQVMREVGKGLKVLFWQPDPMAEGFNPFSIAPFNTGDMPGRVAAFAREGLTKVNPIRDLIAEKGRVDSANGLQFLDEQVNKSLSHPVTGVGQAWGNMYRSLAQKLTQRLLVSPRAIPVTHLTLDLAGAVIDQKTGMVSFETNPIPSLSRLAFTLKSLNPRSELARKAEALDLWEKGLFQQDGVMGFKLLALSEGLDFALYLDKDRAPYEQCIRTILTLFNDGESPGQVIITPHTCRPDLLLELMTPFMQGPHLANASPDVVDAFIDLHSTLLTFLQPVLPPGVPNPDDQALLSSLHSPTPGQSPLRLTGA